MFLKDVMKLNKKNKTLDWSSFFFRVSAFKVFLIRIVFFKWPYFYYPEKNNVLSKMYFNAEKIHIK